MAKVIDWLPCTPPYALAANAYGCHPTDAFKPQKDCPTSVPNYPKHQVIYNVKPSPWLE